MDEGAIRGSVEAAAAVSVAPVSLDEIAQGFVDALSAERSSVWEAGDAVNVALSHAKTRAERGAMYRYLASQGHCSASHVRQLGQVSAAFREQRLPDIPWSLYRAALRVARRAGNRAEDVLTKALADDLSTAELLATVARRRKGVALRADCGGCGARVAIRLQAEQLRGLALDCPVCQADRGCASSLGTLA